VSSVLFMELKTGNFFRGDGDGGKFPSEGGLEMGVKFYPPPRRDFIREHFIKITFIYLYISTLYVILIFIFTQCVYKYIFL
jgi:hypothetical protein